PFGSGCASLHGRAENVVQINRAGERDFRLDHKVSGRRASADRRLHSARSINSYAGELHFDVRGAGAVGAGVLDPRLGDLVQYLEARVGDAAEHLVVRRELRVAVDHEELAAAGVRRGRLGHRQDAAAVAQLREDLVRDGLTGSAGAVALRVATLQHLQALGAEAV